MSIHCHQDDFDTMVLWAEMLMRQTLIHFDELLVANGQVGNDEEEPDLDSPDLLNEDQRALWEAIPKTFIKKEAILVAQESGIPIRTLERFLAVFIKPGILTSTRRGYYTKL